MSETERRPVILGVFTTNEGEARWLASTIQMRAEEAFAKIGIKVDVTSRDDGLYRLIKISLDRATDRGRKAMIDAAGVDPVRVDAVPHHTDHRLSCTGGNETGQPGSAYR